MAFSNASFDGRLVNTVSAWLSNTFEDALLGNQPIFAKLKANGKSQNGFGISMVEPVIYPDASGGGPQLIGVTDPYATVVASEMTGQTGASYQAAEYYINVSVQQYLMDLQSSETQKVDYVQGVMQNALLRVSATLNSHLWAAEENANSAGNRSQIASLRTLFNGGTAASTGGGTPDAVNEQKGNRAVASASTQTPIFNPGGIARNAAGAAYWCTPIINTSQAMTLQILSNIHSMTVRNNDRADMIILHRDIYDKVELLLTNGGGSGGQIYTNSKLGEAGFSAMSWRGADIIADDSCPTTCYLNGASTQYGYNAFAINSNHLRFRYSSEKPEFEPVSDARPIKMWKGRFLGQLTSDNLGRVHCRHVNLLNS